MDTSELEIIIRAQIQQAEDALNELGRAAEKMAAEIEASGIQADAALDDLIIHADATKAEIDSLFKSLQDKYLEINLDDTEAVAKAEALRADIEELAANMIVLKVSDTEAIEKLREFNLRADEILHNEHVRIEVDGAPEAIAELEATKGAGGGRGGAVTAAAGGAGGGGFMNPYVIGAIGAAATGLIPIAATLTTDVMGLAAAFTAAGAGVTAFGVVAAPTIKSIFTAQTSLNAAEKAYASATTASQKAAALKQMQQATAGLDKAQLSALHSLQGFEKQFDALAKSMQTPVLKAFNSALQAGENIMKASGPLLNAAGKAIDGLMKSFASFTAGSQFKSFMDWLAKESGPAITTFGKTFGNVFNGVMSLFKAFTPAIKPVEQGIVHMSAAFAKWAAGLSGSKGFHEFLSYAKANAPTVGEFLGQLAKLVGNLIKSLAPFGAVALKFVADVLKLANALFKPGTATRDLINVTVEAAKVILDIADVIINAITWFISLGSTVDDTSGKFNLFNELPKSVQNAWHVLVSFFHNLMSSINESLRSGWDEAKQGAQTAFNLIQNIWSAITGWFSNLLSNLSSDIANGWHAIGSAMSSAASSAINRVQGLFRGLRSFFSGLASDAFSWGSNLVSMIGQGIESAAHKVEAAVSNIAGRIKAFLGFHSPTEEGPASDSDTWAPNFIKMFTGGLEEGIPTVQGALNRVMIPPDMSTIATTAGARFGQATASSITQHVHMPININAPVYGVNDLHAAIKEGVERHAIPTLISQLNQPARAMGVY